MKTYHSKMAKMTSELYEASGCARAAGPSSSTIVPEKSSNTNIQATVMPPTLEDTLENCLHQQEAHSSKTMQFFFHYTLVITPFKSELETD